MRRIPVVLLLGAVASFSTAAVAQSTPEAEAPVWKSGQATDPHGTRTCSVYAYRSGAYPMIFFYGSEIGAELGIEGASNTPMELTLQVDANPELDGGALSMSADNTAALIEQIRAGGRNLRLSQSVLVDGKFERFHLDLPLAGAVEQLDACRAWLAG